MINLAQVSVVPPQLTAGMPSSTYGTPLTFLVTVTGVNGLPFPTGSVIFTDCGTATSCTSSSTNAVACTNQPTALFGIPGAISSTATCNIASLTGGTHNITATYNPGTGGNADPNYGRSMPSAPLAQKVNQATPNIGVQLPPGSNPSIYGTQLTFTATVTGANGFDFPTGSVSFTDNGATLCPNSDVSPESGGTTASTATCQATLVGGVHSIVATYSGDGNYLPGTPSALAQTVNAASTTVSIPPLTVPSSVNQPVTFTATVVPSATGIPTGSITFNAVSAAGKTLVLCAGVPIAAKAPFTASCTFAFPDPVKYTITATFLTADLNFANSPASTPQYQFVNMAGTTVNVAPPTPSPSLVNQPVTLQATVTPAYSDQGSGLTIPTGSVTFTDGLTGTTLCSPTLSPDGTVPSCSVALLKAGQDKITATYSGDSNFASSSSIPVSQTVTIAPTTTVVVSGSSPSVATQPVTFTATVKAAPPFNGSAKPTAGSFTFALSGDTVDQGCNQVPINTAGEARCTVTFSPTIVSGSVGVSASYANDPNFGDSNNSVTQIVQNFTLSAATMPAAALVTQGNTTNNDPFNPSTSSVTSTITPGFSDPLLVTSCAVSAGPSGYVASDLTCAVTQKTNSGSGTVATFVLSASVSAPIGDYTVNVIATDTKVTTLSQPATFKIQVINKAMQVNVPAATSSPVSVPFQLAQPIPQGAVLSCGSAVYPVTGNGTYGPPSMLDVVGISCSGFASAGTNPPTYTFNLATGGPTASARLSGTGNVFAAAILGVPFLVLIGLLPGARTRRQSFLRFLGAIALIAIAMHTVGCGSGGFKRTSPSVAISGSYALQVESTPSGGGTPTTVAVIPVVIGQ
jgi:hypothetical protein